MIDLNFLVDAVQAYGSDRVEVPDDLLDAARAVTALAEPYVLASEEDQGLRLLVHFRAGVVVGRQKL